MRPPQPKYYFVQAFHTTTSYASSPSVIDTSNNDALQYELIQQIVLFTLLVLGIQGTSFNISPLWFLDLGAFNYMMGSSKYLHNLQSYHDN